jgi:hypothetical protein
MNWIDVVAEAIYEEIIEADSCGGNLNAEGIAEIIRKQYSPDQQLEIELQAAEIERLRTVINETQAKLLQVALWGTTQLCGVQIHADCLN